MPEESSISKKFSKVEYLPVRGYWPLHFIDIISMLYVIMSADCLVNAFIDLLIAGRNG